MLCLPGRAQASQRQEGGLGLEPREKGASSALRRSRPRPGARTEGQSADLPVKLLISSVSWSDSRGLSRLGRVRPGHELGLVTLPRGGFPSPCFRPAGKPFSASLILPAYKMGLWVGHARGLSAGSLPGGKVGSPWRKGSWVAVRSLHGSQVAWAQVQLRLPFVAGSKCQPPCLSRMRYCRIPGSGRWLSRSLSLGIKEGDHVQGFPLCP